MLVLSRKIGERIVIEPGIEIAVVDVRGGKVRIGIVAPESVRIRRDDAAALFRGKLKKSNPEISTVS